MGGVFGDAVVATTILDRLLQHSLTIRVDSYRLRTQCRVGLVSQVNANLEPETV